MLGRLLHELIETASAWESDVAKRREITAVDPVADTRAYDARQLRELADRIAKSNEELNTADFAKLHKTSPQTVVRWIHAKKIPGRHTAQGWLIPSDATPPRRRARPRRSSR